MYLLDSNVFIDASRTYYSPQIAPTFWQWLAEQNRAGRLASVWAVREELRAGEGHLAEWVRDLQDSFWLRPQASSSFARLSQWTMDGKHRYSKAAKEEFLAVADYYLVAQAHAGGHKVVTFEQPAPLSVKRILIPDACQAVAVPYVNPFDIYRALGLRFS